MVKWPFLAVMLLTAVGLFTLGTFLPARSPKSQLIEPVTNNPAVSSQTPIKVHVVGEVLAPGLYECRPNERVNDAILRAGGATPNANINAINLSAFLEDGQQINVPSVVATAPVEVPPTAAIPTPAPVQTFATKPLNLNTATREQLEALPQIGPATANNILTLRQQRGTFKSVEELDQVPGIGAKKMETLRPLVTVD